MNGSENSVPLALPPKFPTPRKDAQGGVRLTPYFEDPSVKIFHGHAIDRLREMPAESINCVVTSPPYWGLRSYKTDPQIWGGSQDCEHEWQDMSYRDALRQNATCRLCGAWSGELGLEPTPDLFVSHLVQVFAEVKRVLRSDGTCWVNIGDSYAANRGYQVPDGKYRNVGNSSASTVPLGLKPKDLIGIPWRVAFALQSDGWWLRSDIIWAKKSPMPESVTDRPTRSHEYIFLLAKSETYYYDHEAIKEPSVSVHGSGNGYKRSARLSFSDENGSRGSDTPWQPKSWNGSRFDGQRDLEIHPNVGRRPPTAKNSVMDAQHSGRRMIENVARARAEGADHDSPFGETRNKRDVWTIGPQPSSDAHFAVFPEELVKPCILAGCPRGGTVLDPFSGSGTVAKVAKENGCNAIGIELNEDYLKISQRRLRQDILAF